MIQTYTVNEYGFKIYVDGELVATFDKDKFPFIIADLSKAYVARQYPLTQDPKL